MDNFKSLTLDSYQTARAVAGILCNAALLANPAYEHLSLRVMADMALDSADELLLKLGIQNPDTILDRACHSTLTYL